jgi:hypothetical protein
MKPTEIVKICGGWLKSNNVGEFDQSKIYALWEYHNKTPLYD